MTSAARRRWHLAVMFVAAFSSGCVFGGGYADSFLDGRSGPGSGLDMSASLPDEGMADTPTTEPDEGLIEEDQGDEPTELLLDVASRLREGVWLAYLEPRPQSNLSQVARLILSGDEDAVGGRFEFEATRLITTPSGRGEWTLINESPDDERDIFLALTFDSGTEVAFNDFTNRTQSMSLAVLPVPGMPFSGGPLRLENQTSEDNENYYRAAFAEDISAEDFVGLWEPSPPLPLMVERFYRIEDPNGAEATIRFGTTAPPNTFVSQAQGMFSLVVINDEVRTLIDLTDESRGFVLQGSPIMDDNGKLSFQAFDIPSNFAVLLSTPRTYTCIADCAP